MKIVWLTNNINQLGGIEQVICGLSSYFSSELNHDVQIFSINSCNGTTSYSLDNSVKVKHCGLDWRKQTFRKLVRLVRSIMCELDADILLTCHPTISYAAVLNKHKFKGKIVVTGHISCDFFSKKRLYCNAVFFRLADQFVVLTNSDRDIYRKLKCNSIVIPNANFRPTKERSHLDKKVILAAGRMESVKGFERLIDAFSRVADNYPDWKLCICGGGSLEESLQTQVQNLGISRQVHFPGSVTNMQDYYQNASIFALSSYYEGFPLVLVEAISFGLPSVCFEIPSTEELLADGGGILAPQGDVSAFATGLDRLMSSELLRNKLSNEAYEISQKYSIPNVANSWMQLFNYLISRK